MAYLLFRDPPPRARRAVLVIARVTSVFQVGGWIGGGGGACVGALAGAPGRPPSHTCPPHPHTHTTATARVSLQRAILTAFPAVCWAYGAGFLFSSFVSVVFWTG